MEPKHKITKELLEDYYIKRKYSVHRIAKILRVKSSNSISQYLKKYGISRPPNTMTRFLTEEFLREQYVTLSKSAKQISQELGFNNKGSVLRAIKRFNLKRNKFTQRQVKEYKKRRSDNRISGRDWYQIKNQAIKRGIIFLITIDDVWDVYIKQNKKCALSGLDIKFKEVGDANRDKTASLDRIDSTKGYEVGNIQIVHKTVNRMKWDSKEPDFLKFCEVIYKFQESKKVI